MGTSLSGLTPATTFDGLLKTSDNDAITSSLKTIGSGDGTDSCLQLSDSALKVNSGSVTIVGTGATSATTSLLVQNSAGDDMFKTTDDGGTTLKSFGASNTLIIDTSGGVSGFQMNSSNGQQRFRIQGTSTATRFTANNTNDAFTFVGNGIYTSGAFDIPSARLHIKGSGATSATTALLIQNSAGTDLLKVRDNGEVLVDEYIYPADGTTNSRFRVSNSSGTYMYYSTGNLRLNPSLVYTSTTYGTIFSVSNSTGDFSLNGATGAKMSIKGNGATSATTALLVENSAGTDTLEVRDDGQINFNGNIYANADYKSIGRNLSNSIRYAGGETRVSVQGTSSANRFHIYSSSTATSIFSVYTQGQQVGIGNGNTTLESTAKLQVDSTTQGFLPPRMTGEQIDAIEEPASGLIIYNTTSNKAVCYNGTSWNDMF